jgi:hypothetical protein
MIAEESRGRKSLPVWLLSSEFQIYFCRLEIKRYKSGSLSGHFPGTLAQLFGGGFQSFATPPTPAFLCPNVGGWIRLVMRSLGCSSFGFRLDVRQSPDHASGFPNQIGTRRADAPICAPALPARLPLTNSVLSGHTPRRSRKEPLKENHLRFGDLLVGWSAQFTLTLR